ncbi:transcriptional regulator Kaiso [Kryptolebias marmoratus]|uniref:Zinc finger and BTB domain containing 33 n=1 Tax=Kryptolebias marmoratus TaxID=37003 RepID=A0A3Q2ZC68_KRYMA|nr:transcriptional regulator Kaiso [Kryptolebias marmoratus]
MPNLKLISATDTQYSAEILKSLNEQRSHGLFCDITIIIQDKKFRAHKTVLSASSTYFYQLFTVAGQVIELNFLRPEIFEQILNYIYSSKIVRVRSDMLEELINAGQILGVKFIANLALPLSQVKGIAGLSKDTEQKNDTATENMPIITESFSISTEEFNQSNKPGENEEDSDDVVFVSHTDAQSRAASLKANSEVIDLDDIESESARSKRNVELNNGVGAHAKQATTPIRINSAEPPSVPVSSPLRSPDSSSNVSTSPAAVSTGSVPSAQARPDSLTAEPTSAPHSSESRDIMGVHKKQVATSSQQGDYKLRLLDVSEVSLLKSNIDVPHTPVTKTVTLNTTTEIDSFSSGCKVYANIGEDTFDIVPVKDDPGEGGSKANKWKRSFMATPLKATDEPPLSLELGPNKKKNKTELEDHYELVMDGKTFFVCIVCKRPYVCLTSLRRHFNTHSWEKKYPCHYCNKVFALAEYRTKHEIHHTGERRYQCLLCNDMFLNYQVLSSHCKSVHNQDPSGRKEKDDGANNLYRLLPGKMVQKRMSTRAMDKAEIPLISEDGSIHHISAASEAVLSSTQLLDLDSMFVEPDTHMQPDMAAEPVSTLNSPSRAATEFEYIMPETY